MSRRKEWTGISGVKSREFVRRKGKEANELRKRMKGMVLTSV